MAGSVSQDYCACRHRPLSVRLTNCCFRLTVIGNEWIWWQWSTLGKGRTIVWIAETEVAQSFWGLTELIEVCRGRRNAYAGFCFQKAVIMSFTPNVWLSCRSLTCFIRHSFSLPLCGMWSHSTQSMVGVFGDAVSCFGADGKGKHVI